MKEKRFLTVILIVVILMSSIPVYAYDDSKAFDPKDVTTWTQGSFPESNTIKLANGSGSTIRRAACSYFAACYALVKAGLMDPKTGTAPIDFIKEVNRRGDWDADWGHYDMSSISKYYPKVTCESEYFGLQNNGMSREEALAVCKNFYNEGKFVIICIQASGVTGGHYVFIDSYKEDGTMVIGDSGFATTDFSLYMNHNVYLKYCHVYSIDGVKCNELASIYSDNVGGTSTESDGAMTEEETVIYNKVKNELELEGMGRFENLLSSDCLVVPEYYDNSYLSVSEQKALSDIGRNVEKNRVTVTGVYHALMSFVGIVLILYSLLMFLAYFFDYNNTFVDISLLGIITLGRFRVVSREEVGEGNLGYNKKDKCTYVTMGMVAVRCVVVLAVGLFLVSGLLSDLVLSLIYFVLDTIEKFKRM